MSDLKNKILQKEFEFDYEVPLPQPELIHTDLKFKNSERPFLKTKSYDKIDVSTALQILNLDLYSMARQEVESLKIKKQVDKKIQPEEQEDSDMRYELSFFNNFQSNNYNGNPENPTGVSFADILRDSFNHIQEDTEYKHPYNENIEVEEVYELFPHHNHNIYDYFEIHFENEDCGDEKVDEKFDVIEYKKKVPSVLEFQKETHSAHPLNTTDYITFEFDELNKKAYFRSIGANLRIKKEKTSVKSSSEEMNHPETDFCNDN